MTNRNASMFAIMAAMGNIPYSWHERGGVSKDAAVTEQRECERKLEELKKQYGMREWTIDGITVWARNEKNAIRKVNNMKNKQK